MNDISLIETGLVFLKVKSDREIPIENVTTLQVKNNGLVSVFINELELHPNEHFTLAVPDGTITKVILDIQFSKTDDGIEGVFKKFSWHKKELDIIYRKLITCKN
ncbi:hypothetical protein [Flavobacterium aestivum]|uniref:hypothetical protein n=1 Tax=Flavobacterium aestivum TaxID=3003257 RepID=UPI00248291AA|nr:hypothetical protein [Flavobacterium aestivum]